MTEYCSDCHSGSDAESGLDIDTLGFSLDDKATFARWERIYDRIAAREMPPQDYEALRPDDFDFLTKTLHRSLERAHAASKQTVLRRLNRQEYQNTLNDLFGTNLPIAISLPEDGRSHEFDNVGSALMLSSVQLGQYLETMQAVFDASIVNSTGQSKPELIKTGYDQTREAERFLGDVWKQLDDGAVAFFKSSGYPSGMLRTAWASKAGYYRIKITGYAYQTTEPVTFAVGSTTFARGAEKPTYFYHNFPPLKADGTAHTVERTVWMDSRYMLEITPWGIADVDNAIKKNGLDAYQGPGLAIQSVEMEGPIEQLPLPGHRLLFDGLKRTEILPANLKQREKSWYRPKFQLEATQEQFEHALTRIAAAAFRRPAKQVDVSDFVRLMNSQLKQGATAEEAYLAAVSAIFTSPEFLFLHESPGKLSNIDVVTRLAYFLGRSTPSKELVRVAATTDLSALEDLEDAQLETSELAKLVNSMLDAPAFEERFIVDFCDAWLNLRDIEFTSPDQKLFPEFDAFLQYSALAETRAFVSKCIRENLGIENLVQSDFAMLNHRLAKHYGLPDIDGPQIRPVKLPSGSVRGGLLSQASVLKVSANGTNTSPVVRGVYVLERIMGQYAPPPPPGIPGVEPDIRGASTLREILDKHRSMDSCASCHRIIDPPGFALESFDAIGGWRDKFRSLGDGKRVDTLVNGRKVRYRLGQDVDASGELLGSGNFDGYVEFRKLLATRRQELAESFVTKLLTFATGREMGFSDRAVIKQIAESTKDSGYGMRDLLLAAVQSEIFLSK